MRLDKVFKPKQSGILKNVRHFSLVLFLPLLVFGLLGCGPQLTINLAETALVWRVDDMFDLDQKQRTQLKQEFRSYMADIYKNEVKSAREIFFDPQWTTQSCSDVNLKYQVIREQFEAGQKKLVARSIGYLDGISDEQILLFAPYLKSEIQKDEKRYNDRKNRLEDRFDRTLQIWNELYDDSLTTGQQQQLKTYLQAGTDLGLLFLENRKKLLNKVESLTKEKKSSELRALFKSYLEEPEKHRDAILNKSLKERREKAETFFLNFVCESSLAQKKAMQDTVAEYLAMVEKVYVKN